jgi:putative transposase
VAEAKDGLGEYFRFYNKERPHEALGYRTPHELYFGTSASMMPMAVGMV